MRRLEKLYLEITNSCGLNCSFCPPNSRPERSMTEAEFSAILGKVAPWVGRLYFHVKGEPLTHPLLGRFLDLAAHSKQSVHLTTNGIALAKRLEELRDKPALKRINLSLHALGELPDKQYPAKLKEIMDSASVLSAHCHISLRLWNREQPGFPVLVAALAKYYALNLADLMESTQLANGVMLGPNISLHLGERFAWPRIDPKPDIALSQCAPAYCHGLHDQAAILCNGDVVPCCLDDQGEMVLGNIHDQTWEAIMSGPRASAIRMGFERGVAAEKLCQGCDYRQRFAKQAQQRQSCSQFKVK